MPEPTRQQRLYTSAQVIVAFARYGVSIATIARAITVPESFVIDSCERAKEAGDLLIMPPVTVDNPRSASLSELIHLRDETENLRARVKELETAQATAQATACDDFAGVAGLTRKEACVVSTLVRRSPATKQRLYDALYGLAVDADTPEPKIVDVFICKIRKKLTPHGILIDTIWGVGYAITLENADKIRALAIAYGASYIPSPGIAASIAEMAAR